MDRKNIAEGRIDAKNLPQLYDEFSLIEKECEQTVKDVSKMMRKGREMMDRAFAPKHVKVKYDENSVFVGNVEYNAAAVDLKNHFSQCGAVARVTIPVDPCYGTPKGFAFVEFFEKSSAEQALTLNASLFMGRRLKVHPKRINLPGISSTNRFNNRGSHLKRVPRGSSPGHGHRSRGNETTGQYRFAPY